MKRLSFKTLLALFLALCLTVSVLPNTPARADETASESTEAPILEALTDEEMAEFDLDFGKLIEEEEDELSSYSDDDVVRVFIVFDDDAVVDAGYSTEDIADNTAALNYSDKLEAAQDEIIENIEAEALDGESLDTNYSFTLFTNAVSADVKVKDLEAIEAVDGVSAVYLAARYETLTDTADPQTMTAGEMVGSYRTWESGFTGAGTKIAIIDTGIDVDHPSFSEDGFLYGLKATARKNYRSYKSYNLLTTKQIKNVLTRLNAYEMYAGLTADDLYVNAKIPFGFNYVDQNLDLNHLIKSNGEHDEHGSHVAGIAAANKYIRQSNGRYSTQEFGVVGVAPDAQLMVMRVFGVNGGAYTDDYMAAIEDAILLGADSVNLSLGSANAGESKASEAYINEIFDKIAQSSTLVVISAGNSGSWADYSEVYGGHNLTDDVSVDTVGSPGSYTNAFTVASANNTSYTGLAAVFNGINVVNYLEGGNAPNLPLDTLDTNGTGTEYDYVLLSGFGAASDFANIDVKDKIVLVSRGDISFYVKHMNAAAAGAAALFVYNNADGKISMNLTGSDATIPAVSITKADALAIAGDADYDEAAGVFTGKVVISKKLITNFNVPDGFLMSDFSSWGVPGDLSLKPEITAPGGNIYSTVDDGKYDVFSGTSMAAPSVAGVSALVQQYLKENVIFRNTKLTRRNVAQSLIMSTATPLAQEDGVLYSPRKQGAGLANASAATSSPAFILAGEKDGNDGKAKIELGDDPARTGEYTFDFTVYNMTSQPVYYQFDSTVLTEKVLQYYFMAGASVELNPEVTYTVSKNRNALLYDLDGNGRINVLDVNALLRYVYRNDFWGFGRNTKIDTFPTAFDFNGNGSIDLNDASLFLQAISRPSRSKIDLKTKVIAVKGYGEEKITVTIKLSDADREYLDTYFWNGMYVDGFIQLDGKIDLSVPFLGFYGNWTDASMFDHFDGMEYLNGDDEYQVTYSGDGPTNYLVYKDGTDGKKYAFEPNMYFYDDVYIADRNAINSESGHKFTSFEFTLIRNAADLVATVTNAKTGEEYFVRDFGEVPSSYFYVNGQTWENTVLSAKLNWNITDAEGNPLPEDTEINISLTAIPAYNVQHPEKPLGSGVSISIPMTVDNTAPEAELVAVSGLDETSAVVTEGAITVSVKDNRYVAAAYIVGSDKKTICSAVPVNQTEKGVATEITLAYPMDVVYLYVADYAGNEEIYRLNLSGKPYTFDVESVEITSGFITTLVKGNSAQLEAVVHPANVYREDVIWYSEDPDIATVDENGVVTAVGKGYAYIDAISLLSCALYPNNPEKWVSDYCVVEVIEIDTDLNTTLWDEEGSVYFGSFNTADLTLNKISEAQKARFYTAAVVDGTLYSSTNEGALYKVDPATFESEYVGAFEVANTDITYAAGNNKIIGTYGPYVLVQELDGTLVFAINTQNYTGGNYITGIAYLDSFEYPDYGMVDVFYAIDSEGVVYYFYLLGDSGYYIFTPISEDEADSATGISTDDEYQYSSLYVDEETGYLFYSCYDGSDEVKLYAIADYYNSKTEEEWVEAYKLGEFASEVWPVSGLYQWNSEVSNDNADAGNRFSSDERQLRSIETVIEKFESITEFETEKLSVDEIEMIPSKTEKQIAVSDVETPAAEAPAEETAPAEEEAPVEETAPAEEEAPAEETAPAEEEAPAEETAPAEEETPAEDNNSDSSNNGSYWDQLPWWIRIFFPFH